MAPTLVGPVKDDREAFLERVIDEARRLGMEPRELSLAIARVDDAGSRPTVYFVECSRWQSEGHAREISEQYRVTARPWSLESADGPPDGTILSTYFHYNDIRRRWPQRLRDVTFIAIAIDNELLEKLDEIEGVRRVIVCEWDRETAEAVAGDVMALVPDSRFEIEIVVSNDPEEVLASVDDDAVVAFAPRVWATLGAKARKHRKAIETSYAIDATELERVGYRLGWAPRLRTA